MKKNDFYLIIGILLVTGIVVLASNLISRNNAGSAAVAVVTIDGKEYGRFPLDKDVTERIELSDGAYNVISIHDGICEIKEASCRDQICVHHMNVQYDGQTIVCLPNKLVVTIENSDEDDIDGATH